MRNISRKIQADKGMTGGVSHFKAADWSKGFVCKFIFSLTSYSVPCPSHANRSMIERTTSIYSLISFLLLFCPNWLHMLVKYEIKEI